MRQLCLVNSNEKSKRYFVDARDGGDGRFDYYLRFSCQI